MMDTHAGGDSSMSYEQEEETKCYCGKDRNPEEVEFQCTMCTRFYHSHCLTCEPGPCTPFMTSYQFFCKRCNASGQDNFTKRQASFSQMCHTAVANLAYHNPDRKYFSKDKEIIPFIEKWWDNLTTAPRRTKLTWHTTIGKTMMKDAEIFTVDDVNAADPQFGLVMDDLNRIGPNCDALFKLIGGFYQSTNYKASTKSSNTESKGRGAKRKAPTETSASVGRVKRGDVNLSAKITPTGFPAEHPYNKDGYRYILAEPDPHAPNWDAFDQSMEWAGKPIPGYLYRRWLDTKVSLSLNDRAPQLKVTEDGMAVTGEKGYSMIRTTHGIKRGAWFYEVIIQDMPQDTATRIGWSQELGNLQAPCGYDKFSYSWRSRKGTTFHQSHGKHFSDAYKEGDVLGFYLYLPYPSDFGDLTPNIYKDKPLVKFKSHLYYEVKDHVTETEKKLKPSEGAKMIMYKNGVNQGTAYTTEIFEGTYHPAISIYKNATVKVQLGPKFKFPPKDIKYYKPISEAADDNFIRHAMGDVLYHIDNEEQLPEF